MTKKPNRKLENKEAAEKIMDWCVQQIRTNGIDNGYYRRIINLLQDEITAG